MKKCLSNEIIESLSRGKRLPEAEEHLKHCSFCQNRLGIAQDFYRQLARELAAGLTPGEINLAASPAAPVGRWIATPVKTMTPTLRPAVYAAASTIDIPKREIQRVGLLATPDKEILIRVLKYSSSGDVKLFLLSKHTHRTELALITIPAIGFEGVTDTSGEVNLGKIDPSGWEQWQVEVRTASAVYTVTAVEDSTGRICASRDDGRSLDRLDSIRVECHREEPDSTLSVQVSKRVAGVADQDSRYRILVTRGDDLLSFQDTASGKVRFSHIPCQAGLQIRIFE